jgi:hypothetical protein
MDRLELKLYPLFIVAAGVLASMGGSWRSR